MEGRREEKRMTEVSEHLGGNRMKKKDNVRSRRTSGPASRFCIFHCGEYVRRPLSCSFSPFSPSLTLSLSRWTTLFRRETFYRWRFLTARSPFTRASPQEGRRFSLKNAFRTAVRAVHDCKLRMSEAFNIGAHFLASRRISRKSRSCVANCETVLSYCS